MGQESPSSSALGKLIRAGKGAAPGQLIRAGKGGDGGVAPRGKGATMIRAGKETGTRNGRAWSQARPSDCGADQPKRPEM